MWELLQINKHRLKKNAQMESGTAVVLLASNPDDIKEALGCKSAFNVRLTFPANLTSGVDQGCEW